MAVSPDDVRRLAALARLALDDGQAEAMAAQLTDILGHVDGLDTLSDDGTAPGGDGAPAPLRADLPGADALDREPADFAPEWRDGFFTVPRLPSHDTRAEEAP